MKIKKILIILLIVFLVGCDGGVQEQESQTQIQQIILPVTSENKSTQTQPPTTEVTQPASTIDYKKLEKTLKNPEKFEAAMKEIARDFTVNGMSMAVFADGEIVYTFNYGYANKSAGILANDDTKYRSASVSKTATAICAMILYEEGLLDLDKPITDILGYNMDSSSHDTPNTTRHLLSHTSSIIDTGAYSNAWSHSPPLSVSRMASMGIWSSSPPGTRYEYSNLGLSVVASVIESITGQRFYTYAQENLFQSLDMDAAFLRTLIKDVNSIANIYTNGSLAHNPRTWGRTESLYNRLPLGNSHGIAECEMIISATDLARMGILLTNDGEVDGVRLLKPETVAQMTAPALPVESNSHIRGLGLRIHQGNVIEGRTITGHSGAALGMASGLYFDTADRTGVALLTNGCSVGLRENGMYGISDETLKLVYSHFFG